MKVDHRDRQMAGCARNPRHRRVRCRAHDRRDGRGFRALRSAVRVAGMICNRVGGRGHLDLLRAAEPEVPIVGGFPASADLAFPERHLGLLMADESNVPQRLIDGWSRLAAEWLDLDAIVEIARSAPALEVDRASNLGKSNRVRVRAAESAWHMTKRFTFTMKTI